MDELDDEEIPSLIEVPYDSNKVIPVTILTGFLGSGKSTLLNYILTANHGKRIAVIENEFSQGLGIEGMIAKSGVNGDNITNFFELNNGCICCTVKDDLLRALEQLVLHKDRFDYVLIETTGMANPGPVITSFWSDQNLGSYLLLDGVVCVVDCANILTYLGSSDVEFEVKQQLCFADRVVINKCDLVAPEMIDAVKTAVKAINCVAELDCCTYARIDLDFVLNTKSYDGNNGSSTMQCLPCLPTPMTHSVSKSSVNSVALQFSGSFDLPRVRQLLDFLLYANGDNGYSAIPSATLKMFPSLVSNPLPLTMKIYRMKGVFHFHEESMLYILQAVHNLFELDASSYLRGGKDDQTNGQTSIIVIGVNLCAEALRLLFVSCEI